MKRDGTSEKPEGLTKAGVGCLSLIAVPFLGVGIGMLVHAFHLSERGHKDARGAAAFGTIALTVGFLLALGILWAYRASRRRAQLALNHPGDPWMWNPQWAAGSITDSAKSATIAFWVFAIFWNGVSWPVAMAIALPELRRGDYKVAFVLLFPFIGLFMLAGAMYMTLRYLKFGRSTFQLETLPGCVGGWLAGTIETSVPIMGDEGIHLSLRCINRVTTGSGKNRSTTEHTLWEDEQLLTGRMPTTRLGGSAIPVAFAVPSDCAPTRDSGNNDILWRLRARAAMAGADYAADFIVPVFKHEHPTGFIPKADAIAAKHRSRDFEAQKRNADLDVITDAAGRKRFNFPAGRNRKLAMTTTAFLLVFGTITAVIFAVGAPWVFGAIFGLIAALLVYVSIKLWFHSVELRVDRHGLERRWRMLGFAGGRTVQAADAAAVRYKITSEVNGQPYYTVVLATNDDKKMTLSSNLLLRDAKQLATEIAELLGVEASAEKRSA